MAKVGELVIEGDVKLKDAVEDVRRYIKQMLQKMGINYKTLKFVGFEFHFLIDDEIQVKQGFWTEGYDPEEFKDINEGSDVFVFKI